jgi:rhodanese-related sulfurtransferase
MLNTNKFLFCFFLTLFTCLLNAAELEDVNPEQLKSMQQNNALVIDIRTEKEWNSTGIIPGSRKIEFFNANGDFDQEKWLKQLQKQRQSTDQPIILVCRSGNRSRMVGTMLTKELNIKNVYHLEKGIKSWIQEGNKTEPACANKLACLNQ